MSTHPLAFVPAPDVIYQEMLNFSGLLTFDVNRLWFVSKCIEYPVNYLGAASDICSECADVLEQILQEVEAAQAEIRSRYSAGGSVVVRFSTGEAENA